MEMNLSNHKSGLNAELMVKNYLIRFGYSIMEHRYKTPYGEIDLIVNKEKLLLFIEVKKRKIISNNEEIICKRQKKRCCEAAIYFLSFNPQFLGFILRFDCFLIDYLNKFKHIKNAWEVTESKLSSIL